jgi:hypothetical protein
MPSGPPVATTGPTSCSFSNWLPIITGVLATDTTRRSPAGASVWGGGGNMGRFRFSCRWRRSLCRPPLDRVPPNRVVCQFSIAHATPRYNDEEEEEDDVKGVCCFPETRHQQVFSTEESQLSYRLRSTMVGAEEGNKAKRETWPHARTNLRCPNRDHKRERERECVIRSASRISSKKRKRGGGATDAPNGVRIEDEVVSHMQAVGSPREGHQTAHY